MALEAVTNEVEAGARVAEPGQRPSAQITTVSIAVRQMGFRNHRGNHLSVLPVLEELGRDTLVVQFDAHLDIYHLSDCTTEPSHGNFLLHAEGELPALVVVDAVARLVPGVVGDESSVAGDTFARDGLLDFPQYTRPAEFRGWKVPDVLL